MFTNQFGVFVCGNKTDQLNKTSSNENVGFNSIETPDQFQYIKIHTWLGVLG